MAVVGGGVTCETIVVSDGLVVRESKEEATTITGSCRCGAVRYRIVTPRQRRGHIPSLGMRFNTINASRSRDPLFYQARNGACRAVASVFDVGAYETALSTIDHSPSRYPY